MSVTEWSPTNHGQFRRERLARIASRAVPDHGIDLRRHRRPPELNQPTEAKGPTPKAPKLVPKPLRILSIAEIDEFDLVKIPQSYPKVGRIQRVVASYYKLSLSELMSRRRSVAIVRPRQISQYLCYTLTPCSFPEIGRRHGGQDHTTAINSVRRIEKLIAQPEQGDLRSDIATLTDILVPRRDMAPALEAAA